jgi:uncharacterized protein (UPF0210 family)
MAPFLSREKDVTESAPFCNIYGINEQQWVVSVFTTIAYVILSSIRSCNANIMQSVTCTYEGVGTSMDFVRVKVKFPWLDVSLAPLRGGRLAIQEI